MKSAIKPIMLLVSLPIKLSKAVILSFGKYTFFNLKNLLQFIHLYLNENIAESKLYRFTKKSEKGVRFTRKDIKRIFKITSVPYGVTSNNEYLAGSGYLGSSSESKKELEVYLKLNTNPEYIFINPSFVSAFGHINYLGTLEKFSAANFYKNKKKILFYSSNINDYYINLFSKFYTLIKGKEYFISTINTYLKKQLHPMNAMLDFDNNCQDLYSAITLSEDRKKIKNIKQPLLEMPDNDVDYAIEKIKNHLGVVPNWFVTFHMREGEQNFTRGGNNVNLSTYISAIKFVIDSGGYAIRIGNSGMTDLANIDQELKKSAKYFDYANSAIKSELLDVFFMSNCRFFVGSSSGPLHTPMNFDVPVLYTNCIAIGMTPKIPGYCLPNLYKDDSTNKFLNISDMLMNADVGWKVSPKIDGLSRIPNTSEDIKKGVEFVLDEVLKG